MPIQKVRKCPRCGGLCLLWTDVCMRCGRVDVLASRAIAAVAPAPMPAPPPSPVSVIVTGSTPEEIGAALKAAGAPPPAAPATDPIYDMGALLREAAENPAARVEDDDLQSTFTDEIPGAASSTRTDLHAPTDRWDPEEIKYALMSEARTAPTATSSSPTTNAASAPPPPSAPPAAAPQPPTASTSQPRPVLAPQPDEHPATAEDDRRHFLVLGWRDAVELVPGRRFTIGRNPGHNLVIPRPEVSRQHAAIEWEGTPPRPLLRDLTGQRTFLNGRPVSPDYAERLKDGDKVHLGPSFIMSYRFLTEGDLVRDVFGGEARPISKGGTRRTRPVQPAAEPEPVAAAAAVEEDDVPLEGDFSRTPAKVVLEAIFRRGLTGGLIITNGPGSGALRIEQGRVKGVVFRTLTGKQAAEEVKALTSGNYRFKIA